MATGRNRSVGPGPGGGAHSVFRGGAVPPGRPPGATIPSSWASWPSLASLSRWPVPDFESALGW